MFPLVYERTVREIRDGEYGEELRELFRSRTDLAVDCEEDLFVCGCGNWETGASLDVYGPAGAGRKPEKHGYPTKEDLKRDFVLLRRHPHFCTRCGREMERIDDPESYLESRGLACPECGTVNGTDPSTVVLWD